jgi:uncharacterized protein
MKKQTVLTSLIGGLALTGMATAVAAADAKLPRSMVWSAYDLGSSGYAEASGIANALQKKYPTRIRIVPAGTSIGRLLPMATGKVKYGYLANEVYFATEGTFDFADQSWGPQDLRIVLGRPATVGLAVAKDSGVKTIADLKGKRVGFVKGNPSVNVKNDGYIAFGGLTRKDIVPVWFGSYSAMKDALLANQLDAFGSVTTSSNMRQIEASPRGLIWPPFDPGNKKGWAAMQSIISFVAPVKETKGAGLSEKNPVWLVGYRYPMITTYATTTTDEVYNLVKAIDESFSLYNKTTASSGNWILDRSAKTPADAPWHDGTIKYAKEKGVWSKEDQAWHDKRLARLNAVRALWDKTITEFDEMRVAERKKGNKINAKKTWPGVWAKARAEGLK